MKPPTICVGLLNSQIRGPKKSREFRREFRGEFRGEFCRKFFVVMFSREMA
jgi:hypothetical protein